MSEGFKPCHKESRKVVRLTLRGKKVLDFHDNKDVEK